LFALICVDLRTNLFFGSFALLTLIILPAFPAGEAGQHRRRLESKGNAFGQAAEGGREKALPFHSGTRD
jgi:hypothetical protein